MATITSAAPPVKPAPAGTCRLTLTIHDTDYRLRPLAVDPQSGVARAFRLRKLSGDGAVYTVALTECGAECTCPDWEFRRNGLDVLGCKHIRALRNLGLLG